MIELGGCNDLLARITAKIDGFHRPVSYCPSRSKGVVICGKPGTGKTTIALALADRSKLPHVVVNAPDIFQSEEGASEAKLKAVFDEAKQYPAAIVILDEIDMIAGSLSNAKASIDARVSSLLLSLLDGLNNDTHPSRVFVLAITSRLHAIDPCFLRSGRLDCIEEIVITSAVQRREILHILSKRLPFATTSEREHTLDRVSRITHGFVPCDLQSLCAEVILRLVTDQAPCATFSHFEKALSVVRPSNLNEYATRIPDITFSHIYGMDAMIQDLKISVIHPFHHPEEYVSLGIAPPRGILLHGPPGVGKTMMCCALASEAAANFMFVDSSQVRSKVVGESEHNIANLFSQARSNAPCILFIDQIDMLLPRRGTSSTSENTSDRIVTGFLTEMDGLMTRTGDHAHMDVLVVATTNRLSAIDPAVLRPGRFDELIHIPLPNLEQRHAIIRGFESKIPLSMSPEDYSSLARNTEGWSGATIDNLFREAAMISLRESLHNSHVTPIHIASALKNQKFH